MPVISLRIDEGLLAQLNELARSEETRRSFLIRRAIRRYLEESGSTAVQLSGSEGWRGALIRYPDRDPRQVDDRDAKG